MNHTEQEEYEVMDFLAKARLSPFMDAETFRKGCAREGKRVEEIVGFRILGLSRQEKLQAVQKLARQAVALIDHVEERDEA